MTGGIPHTGRLRDYRLPKILSSFQHAKNTGVLIIRRNDQEKSIFFQDGDIVFASSKYSDDGLGENLLKSGRISLEQFDQASKTGQKTKKRFGAVLVGMGVIEPKELFRLVTAQVKRIVCSLFTWIDGEFRFEEGDLPVHEVITLKMSTANIILSGIQQINDLNMLQRYLPPGSTVLHMTDDPFILFQDINLTNGEQDVLALVDGVRTENEIFNGSPLSSFETMKLVYFFISVGLVVVPSGEPTQESENAADKETGEEPRDKEYLRETINVEMAEKVRERKQAAYFEALHDHSLSQEESPGEAKTAVHDKLEKAYEAMERQDHYGVLGLDQNATTGQIKKAYFRLAKDYHPDRHLQAGLEGLTSQLEALFQRITEAYDTLLIEEKRRDYDTGLTRKKPGDHKKGQKPEDKVLRGEDSLKRGEFKAAAYFFEAALKEAPDQARYHALLAKAASKIKGRGREAEAHYRRAIELEPAQIEYYVQLAFFYKRSGMDRLARRQFEAALQWDPENTKIKAEIEQLGK